jgi:hypothetical protein
MFLTQAYGLRQNAYGKDFCGVLLKRVLAWFDFYSIFFFRHTQIDNKVFYIKKIQASTRATT